MFQLARHKQIPRALQYIQGIQTLEKGKANMERMEEVPESEYRAYQHFISESKWYHHEVLSKVPRTLPIFSKPKKRSASNLQVY